MTKYLLGATPRRKLLFWPLASEGSQSTERERSDGGADQSIVGVGPAVSVVRLEELHLWQGIGYLAGFLTSWLARKAEMKAGSRIVCNLS